MILRIEVEFQFRAHGGSHDVRLEDEAAAGRPHCDPLRLAGLDGGGVEGLVLARGGGLLSGCLAGEGEGAQEGVCEHVCVLCSQFGN